MILVDKPIGPEAGVKLEIVAGKIVLSGNLNSAGLGGGLTMSVDADYFLDKLAEAIPGSLDDAIIAVIKSAIKAI